MNIILFICVLSVFVIVSSMTYIVYKIYTTMESFSQIAEKISLPEYKIEEIEGFLTSEQCDHIIEISHPQLQTSMVYSDKSDVYDKKTRISEQAWLREGTDPAIDYISKKVSEISGFPIENQEDMQVVSYKKGGFFTPHYDSCEGDHQYCKRMNGSSGSRYLTYLIYLNDDFEGGETVFPQIKRVVKPKKGKCIVFQSTMLPPDGRTILQALHGGNPVISGEKWICNKWVRTNAYSS